MSTVIKIEEELYKRLAVYASGFETPSQVISRMVDFYEKKNNINENIAPVKEKPLMKEKSTKLEIIYYPVNDVDKFKILLIKSRKAHIKLYKTNGQHEIKIWNAHNFNNTSNVENNLRSGYLMGWKNKGIYKAELSTNKDDIL